MPAYAIKVKTVIVIDNVLDTISALQGNLTGTVSTVETDVYTFENEWFYLFCRLTITTAQEAAIPIKRTKPRRRIVLQRGSLMR